MWGHYTKNHTGIVIEFNTNYKFFRNLIKISYDNEIPKLKDSLINDLCLTNTTAREELRRLFLTKSIHWKYEQEYRFELSLNHLYREFLSSPNNIALFPQFFKEIKNKNDFVHPYTAPNCINAVYLDVNITEENEKKIKTLIKTKFPHAKIYRAFLSENEFKVEFKEIIK